MFWEGRWLKPTSQAPIGIAKHSDRTNVPRGAPHVGAANRSSVRATVPKKTHKSYKDFWEGFQQYVKELKEEMPSNLTFRYPTPLERWAKVEPDPVPEAELELRIVERKELIVAEVRLNGPNSRRMYRALYVDRESIESQVRSVLDWQIKATNRNLCTISLSEHFNTKNRDRWNWAYAWIVDNAQRFSAAFESRLKGIDSVV
jgi:hypothetical protein